MFALEHELLLLRDSRNLTVQELVSEHLPSDHLYVETFSSFYPKSLMTASRGSKPVSDSYLKAATASKLGTLSMTALSHSNPMTIAMGVFYFTLRTMRQHCRGSRGRFVSASLVIESSLNECLPSFSFLCLF